MIRFLPRICFFIVLSVCFCVSDLKAQEEEGDRRVRAIIESGNLPACFALGDEVINSREELEKAHGEQCLTAAAAAQQAREIDFAKHTLISYRVTGDCFVRARAEVFRNSEKKKYKVTITKIYGGCRAGGFYQKWIVVEKIPSDYAVEFLRGSTDETSWRKNNSLLNPPETLETKSYAMEECGKLNFDARRVVRNETEFLKVVRADRSRERCLERLEKIDFDRYSLLGIEINSGYCRTPTGLKYRAVRSAAKKEVALNVSYTDPQGMICRRRSRYDLWVLVPKIPADFGVKFDVKAVSPDNRSEQN